MVIEGEEDTGKCLGQECGVFMCGTSDFVRGWESSFAVFLPCEGTGRSPKPVSGGGILPARH